MGCLIVSESTSILEDTKASNYTFIWNQSMPELAMEKISKSIKWSDKRKILVQTQGPGATHKNLLHM